MTPAPRRRASDLEDGADMPKRDDIFVALVQQIGTTQKQIHESLLAHQAHCNEREAKATEMRHELRAEVAVRLGGIDIKVDEQGKQLAQASAQLKEQITLATFQLEQRIVEQKSKAQAWLIGVLAGGASLFGLTVVYLLAQRLGL